MSKDSTPTIKAKSAQLDEIIAWFEGDDFELEQASAKLQEAAKLAKEIEHDLGKVANDIRQVKQSFASDED